MNRAVGGYGQSSVEALALGSVVFCDVRHVDLLGLHLISPVSLEEASMFWDRIGAEGDFDAFAEALSQRRNASG